MSLITFPLKLIDIIKGKERVQDYLLPRTREWFFSETGHQAYNKADTVSDKTIFFYNYLCCISPQKKDLDFLERIAFIMASSMDQSNLPFAGYPNILDKDKNPFIGLVEDGFTSPENNKDFETAVLLAVLDGENDIEGYFSPLQKAYLKLTYSTDGTYSDMQKIERTIIWSGKCDEKDKLQNLPFRYEIAQEIILETMDEEQNEEDGDDE
ncbi:MAG: hypothetical protein KHW87_04235 [Clostridiales bacterium]|nr:hypothetical protein [Clostridiales bacterium]